MDKLYFAHPVNVFGTELKTHHLIPFLQRAFKTWEIEDPDQPHHQQGYKDWKARLEGNPQKHGGMSYYYDVVLPACRGCVAMPFLDCKLGAGVAGEAKFFAQYNHPVFLLQYSERYSTWRASNFTSRERMWLLDRNPLFVLSIEETRARTWLSPEEYNKVKRPYETAHLIEFDKSKWTSEYLKSIKK